MSKKEKGEFGYLKYKEVLTCFLLLLHFNNCRNVTGLIIFKSRNNYMLTLVATVLILPSAKIAVSYFILLPHKVCDENYIQALKLQGRVISFI